MSMKTHNIRISSIRSATLCFCAMGAILNTSSMGSPGSASSYSFFLGNLALVYGLSSSGIISYFGL